MNSPPRPVARPALQRDTLWIAALLAALAALLGATQASWRLDRVVYDQALAWSQRPVPADITVIAIDDASLAAIGRWPWPRAVHATLLEQLVPLQPRALLLDLVLSEPDADPRQDQLLAAALRRLDRAVLPVPWVSVHGTEPQWLLPTPVLAAAARLGAAESLPDADGVLRHTFLQVGPAASPRPHVALQMLQAAGEPVRAHQVPRTRPEPLPAEPAADGAVPDYWRRDGRLAIRFAGPPGHVDRVSYVDVLRGAVPAARLQGRHLLVGMTAQGLGDSYATPVGTQHATMPGVEVLAQTLHMLRQGDSLRLPEPATVAAGSALLVFAGVLGMARLGQRGALLAVGLAIATWVLVSAAAVAAGLWWPPVPAVAAALLAYPLWSWRRLEHAVAGLDAQILQLHSGPNVLQPAGAAPPGADAIEARLQRLQSAGVLLQHARRYLADVLESLPTAMLVADAQYRVLMANAQAAALFEVEDAVELEGLDLPRLLQEFRGSDAPDWTLALSRMAPGAQAQAWELRLEGQGDFVLRLSAAELAGMRRLLLSIADVEPVKRAERQREEALAIVSHDLRSPASAILLLTDPATAPAGGPAASLPQVRQLAQRSLELSDAFVRYAQADLLAPLRAPVPVQTLVADALAELRPRAHALGLRLVLQLPAADAVVLLDRQLVVRALANLVSNALRHSPPAGQVQLRCTLDAAGACFEVADEGPGLSAAQQTQLHGADEGLRSGDGQGLGLGLRFVQRVARRHGGRLRWLPTVGEGGSSAGGTFQLHLPAPESGNP